MEAREVIDKITSVEEKKRIDMVNKQRENNKVLAEAAKTTIEEMPKKKLSKRA